MTKFTQTFVLLKNYEFHAKMTKFAHIFIFIDKLQISLNFQEN